MEFQDIIKHRYMVRKYKDRPIEREIIDKILKLAEKAPSAGNTQPQEVIVVEGKNTKKELYNAALRQDWVKDAPVLLVVVANWARTWERYGERGRDRYSVIDGAFTSMIILLSAVNFGLGSCFVGAFDDKVVSRILGLSGWAFPVGIICLGYPAEGPLKIEKKEWDEFASYFPGPN